MTRALVLVLAASLVVAPACARREKKLGTGEDVGFCRGWEELDNIQGPDVVDRDDVLEWADGSRRVLKRIDLRVDIDEKDPPPFIKDALARVDRALASYRDEVERADDAEELRRAAARLAATDFDGTVNSLTSILHEQCTKEDREQ